jgi:hypothetical protein
LIKPLQEKIEDAMQKGDNELALSVGKQFRALSEITVYAYVNRYDLNFNPHSGKVVPMQVKGVPYSYKVSQDQYGNKANGYWLLFGNWATAKAGEDIQYYHFIHPKKTPYVENVAVLVFGADDRIKELLSSVDWAAIQKALTP